MPNRILKESICVSDTIDQMTPFQEILFYRLIVNCDDYGRMDARPAILKAKLFPLKERITLREIADALRVLAGIGCVCIYDVGGKPYLCLPSWEVHQTVRAKKSKFPAPGESLQAPEIICEQMQADVPVIQSNPNPIRESNSIVDNAREPRFTPPTIEEVATYCRERKNGINPILFVEHYTANGWMRGKTKISDWKSCVRTWEQRENREKTDEVQPSELDQKILEKFMKEKVVGDA